MAERLIAQGAEVNAKNCLGETPLMQGTKQNHDKMVLLLLQNGADREMKTRQGWNARLIAEALGSGSVQKLLTQ
jgi:ankyrin repeat protein